MRDGLEHTVKHPLMTSPLQQAEEESLITTTSTDSNPAVENAHTNKGNSNISGNDIEKGENSLLEF